jgi:hypothetical protein
VNRLTSMPGTSHCAPALDLLCCGMKWTTRTSLSLRMGRMTRMLMLVLGILSVPSVGVAAMQRPHCAQHDTAAPHQEAHSSNTHQVPEPPHSPSWQNATEDGCPHCPAPECARVAPCAASSSAAISAASLAVSQLATHRVITPTVRIHPYSTTCQPPTPPPYLIS